jgi:ubiquinone/menaquinone biosynthesis C-methylase UbiE
MATKWDEAARTNILYYIATTAWQSEEDFIKSGEYDAGKILSCLPPFNHSSSSVLEIGCGIGRLLRPMSNRFAVLFGVDISAEMIQYGRQWLRDYPKVQLVQTKTNDLRMFKDNQFDFVYSYITFQHIPCRKLIIKYIKETQRVLKPGGYFRFQTLRIRSPIELLKNRVNIFLNRRKNYFVGYSWRESTLEKTVQACGFKEVNIQTRLNYPNEASYGAGQPESHLWCTARKFSR